MREKTTPKQPEEKLPAKVRLRLMISIPLVFALFTLASGYLAFGLSRYFFQPAHGPQALYDERALLVLLSIFLMAGLAAGAGVMVAYAFTRPLKKISTRAEALIPGKVMRAPDEVALLNNTLEEVFSTLDHYMKEGKLLEGLPEGVITLDKDGTVTSLNRVAERVLGIGSQKAEGRAFSALFQGGNEIFLNLLRDALNEGSSQTFEDIAVAGKDRSMRLKGRITPRVDEAGGPAGVFVTFQDPSELEYIRNWLKQADQMAGLGTMAAGIAHEIRNPLASIRGLMELLREELTLADPKRTYTEAVIREVDRLNQLVEEVLDFAQVEALAPEPKDVNELLRQAVSLTRYRVPEKTIEISEELKDDLPPVLCRPDKLVQAFQNLLLNAVDATPAGGSIRVTSTFSDNTLNVRKVILRFSNTGSFIPPEDRERIFLPFFTTKPGGTGLGLPITHRIVSTHGGKIKVESARDTGTTFEIELPVIS